MTLSDCQIQNELFTIQTEPMTESPAWKRYESSDYES